MRLSLRAADPELARISAAVPAGLPAEIREEVFSEIALAAARDGAIPSLDAVKQIVRDVRRGSHLDRFARRGLDAYAFDTGAGVLRSAEQLTSDDVRERMGRGPSRIVTSPCPHCGSTETRAKGCAWITKVPRTRCQTCGRSFVDRARKTALRRTTRKTAAPSAVPCPRCGSRYTNAIGYYSNGCPGRICRGCKRKFADPSRPRRKTVETPERNSWRGLRNRTRVRPSMCVAAWARFEHFLRDMGPRPPQHYLKRLDPRAPYGPANCRWEPLASGARPTLRLAELGETLVAQLRRAQRHVVADRIDTLLREHGVVAAT